ncbi:MAG: hypothetical protein K9H58_04425 [Bacteroidales bacterium]|nr:hypothetical protein [Bacteroidales bacterium]
MKNLHIYLFLISLFIAFSSNAVVITGDLTAVYGTSLPPNTYQVPMWSNIYIPTGSSFTIEPGVIIEFDYNSQMFTEPGSNLVILENTEFQMKEDTRFIIKGDLFIHGTSSGPARFYEHPANIGACWGGIIIDSCTIDTIFIDYAHIQDVEKFSFGLPLSDLAGAIFVNNSTFNVFEIRNSTIRNNFTKLMGAGICFNFSSCSNPVIIENNRFLDNRCRSKGGAIYINSLLTTKFKIFKNEFSKNRARNGGAIFLEDAIFGGIDLVKNHFVKNQARDNGGACFFRGDVVNIEIIENEFNSNRAVNFDGGGIYFSNFYHNSPMIILFNIFDSNKARDGGAVCSKHEKGSDKEYLNNLFMYNSAGDEGGAIYCEANYNFVNNTIVCNNSGISTGGIYAASTIVGSYGILNNILEVII